MHLSLNDITSKILLEVGHSWKNKQTQVALKVPRWCHNSGSIFRLVRLCIGLMTSQLWSFSARLILFAHVIPKLILLFSKAGWSAKPYSINFWSHSNSRTKRRTMTREKTTLLRWRPKFWPRHWPKSSTNSFPRMPRRSGDRDVRSALQGLLHNHIFVWIRFFSQLDSNWGQLGCERECYLCAMRRTSTPFRLRLKAP